MANILNQNDATMAIIRSDNSSLNHTTIPVNIDCFTDCFQDKLDIYIEVYLSSGKLEDLKAFIIDEITQDRQLSKEILLRLIQSMVNQWHPCLKQNISNLFTIMLSFFAPNSTLPAEELLDKLLKMLRHLMFREVGENTLETHRLIAMILSNVTRRYVNLIENLFQVNIVVEYIKTVMTHGQTLSHVWLDFCADSMEQHFLNIAEHEDDSRSFHSMTTVEVPLQLFKDEQQNQFDQWIVDIGKNIYNRQSLDASNLNLIKILHSQEAWFRLLQSMIHCTGDASQSNIEYVRSW